VFDSLDVPENALDGARPADAAATVNLGSLQQQLAALQLASGGERISPTLDAILELLDESPAEDAAAAAEEFVAQVAASATSNGGDSTSLFRPWAQQVAASSGDAQAALGADDGCEQQQQEAEVGMEGVAAEYAYGAAPAAPVDADDGAALAAVAAAVLLLVVSGGALLQWNQGMHDLSWTPRTHALARAVFYVSSAVPVSSPPSHLSPLRPLALHLQTFMTLGMTLEGGVMTTIPMGMGERMHSSPSCRASTAVQQLRREPAARHR
jgi:hypothetical protein